MAALHITPTPGEQVSVSRKPDDMPALNEKMIEEFAAGHHAGQSTAA